MSVTLVYQQTKPADDVPDLDLVHDLALEMNELKTALTSARIIGAAVGIIMATDKVTYDVAFRRLASTSMDMNRKLRLLAEDVVLTGVIPERLGRNDEVQSESRTTTV